MRIELAVQGSNQKIEAADKKRIFKYAVTQFIVYFIVFIALLMILKYAKRPAE